jgi:hypothetical protein
MELDDRQGDLFMHLIKGAKYEEYPNYRKKIDALGSEGREKVHQEGEHAEKAAPVESGGEQGKG